jgi:hypothetical protein
VPALVIDLAIVVVALARAAGFIPLVSGHVLFLTYALVTGNSWVVRVPAALVLIHVLYLKIFLWHDLLSLGGGLCLACLAAVACRRVSRKETV